MTKTDRIIHVLRFGRLNAQQIADRTNTGRAWVHKVMAQLAADRVVRMHNTTPREFELR